MSRRGLRGWLRLAVTVVAVILGGSALLAVGASPASGTAPTAVSVTEVPTVGAVYFPSVLGLGPLLGLPHVCSASVVHSPGHDLIVTAAHCVYGDGLGMEFAPGYHDGQTPFGVWPVVAAYVAPQWQTNGDPQHDYAFLRVADRRIAGRETGIEDVTGANVLGPAPTPGVSVTVSGYLLGSRDEPITCTAAVYDTDGFPSFDCGGFGDGTSGSPWLTGPAGHATLVGVLGGLHQGGCTPSTSYSSAFGPDTVALYQRATSGGHGDLVVAHPDDGC